MTLKHCLLLLSLSLAACASNNSDFSCKATAKDSCLTIEEVDAMTCYADNAGRDEKFGSYGASSAQPGEVQWHRM